MKTFRVRILGDVGAVVALLLASYAVAQEPAEEPPPLPFHTIEGVGGGAITPMAYLVNPGDACHALGRPAAALSYVNIGSKNLDAITVTETLFQRIELGFAADRLGLGTLPSDIRDTTGFDIDRSDVWLNNFNVRALLVKENTCFGGIALPAITAGVHFKYNNGIRGINERLGGALSQIGYDRDYGVDYTLTATKTFPKAFGRPLIATAGLRLSDAANLGFLGFSNTYHASFEGSVAYLATDWLLFAYELRQKTSPYGQIAGLIGDEDPWQTIDVALILNKQTTFVAGWGSFGTVANTVEDGAWFLQIKHEF